MIQIWTIFFLLIDTIKLFSFMNRFDKYGIHILSGITYSERL